MSKEIIQPIELPQNCKECIANVEAMGAEMQRPFIVLANTINELNADTTLLDPENPVDQTVLIGLKGTAFANRLSPGMQNNEVQEAIKAAADCPGAVIVGADKRKAAFSMGFVGQTMNRATFVADNKDHWLWGIETGREAIDMSAVDTDRVAALDDVVINIEISLEKVPSYLGVIKSLSRQVDQIRRSQAR